MPQKAPPHELAMFPLGAVLLPGMVLPLHIFEPRYRALVQDVLAGDREFGVVLIDRGHEVGGGDRRTDLGTVATVIETEELEDGRWLLIAVGTRRIRVVEWLDDDPYPRALVEDAPDGPPDGATAPALEDLTRTLRRVLALRAELGEDTAPATVELHDDPSAATFQASILSGATAHDAQRLLAAEGPTARLGLLREVLEDTLAVLEFRLASDEPAPDDDR